MERGPYAPRKGGPYRAPTPAAHSDGKPWVPAGRKFAPGPVPVVAQVEAAGLGFVASLADIAIASASSSAAALRARAAGPPASMSGFGEVGDKEERS